MRSIAGTSTGWNLGRRFIPSLPGTRKGWLLLLLALAMLAFLVIGVAKTFNLSLMPSSPRQSQAPTLQWRDVMGVVNRYGALPRGGAESVDVDILFATPQYFASVHKQPPQSALEAPSLLFYVTENVHVDDLPTSPPQPLLIVNGSSPIEPVDSVVMADSPHHRGTMVRYSAADLVKQGVLVEGSTVQITFATEGNGAAEESTLSWALPLQYSPEYASADVVLGGEAQGMLLPEVSGIAVLAVLGGLLAAMWPCLFQLTAYFIPAMAGMNMQEASTAQGLRPRVGVVKTAIFFVIGFTIVYTLAGAVIGFGSQQLSNMESFYSWQRYLSLGAGVILMGLAIRVAVRARAPLVCKMPLARRMAGKGVASPWESMVVGVTFATGCMTCFGSAVLIGMVLYVGLAGSAIVGATILFLFSLGMGIPLVIGAIAMAKVLPLLFRMEKVIPWMGLASAGLIAGYALLLITGNFMAISSWLYRLMGISPLVS